MPSSPSWQPCHTRGSPGTIYPQPGGFLDALVFVLVGGDPPGPETLELHETCMRDPARAECRVSPACLAPRVQGEAPAFSRTSVGLDLSSAMLGSEGCLGIITSVVVKVVPCPQVTEHASIFFRDFSVSAPPSPFPPLGYELEGLYWISLEAVGRSG